MAAHNLEVRRVEQHELLQILGCHIYSTLRKHANSNTCILKISPPKTESFQIKTMIFFKFLLKT